MGGVNLRLTSQVHRGRQNCRREIADRRFILRVQSEFTTLKRRYGNYEVVPSTLVRGLLRAITRSCEFIRVGC
jgi:hypothetical protein